MKTVALDQVGHEELALPPRVQEALGLLVGSAKEGLLALSVCVGLGVLAELMEEEVCRRGRRKGQARPRAHRRAARARGRRGDARRRPRPGGAIAGTQRRRPGGGAAAGVRVLSRPRPADQIGAGANARRRLHPPLLAHAGAGRRRGRAAGALDVEVGGLAYLHRADTGGAVGPRKPPLGRCAAGSDNARRDQSGRARQRGRARNHDQGRKDPARAPGRKTENATSPPSSLRSNAKTTDAALTPTSLAPD